MKIPILTTFFSLRKLVCRNHLQIMYLIDKWYKQFPGDFHSCRTSMTAPSRSLIQCRIHYSWCLNLYALVDNYHVVIFKHDATKGINEIVHQATSYSLNNLEPKPTTIWRRAKKSHGNDTYLVSSLEIKCFYFSSFIQHIHDLLLYPLFLSLFFISETTKKSHTSNSISKSFTYLFYFCIFYVFNICFVFSRISLFRHIFFFVVQFQFEVQLSMYM